MTEWTIGAVLDAIADVIPDRLMTVCDARRSTFAESAQRTTRLASYLGDKGIGIHRERSELQRWECGQDRVALIMFNDLYPDMVIGCLKARAVPVNVNHYYLAGEISDLLDYVRPRVVIYHRCLGARFGEVLPSAGAELMISIEDGSDAPPLPGAVPLDDVLAAGDPQLSVAGSPDDLIMMCTGGTTGRPKGVLWRQGDMYVASMVGADHAHVDEIHQKIRGSGRPWFAVSPLMHAAGMWTAFSAFLNGVPVVLYDDRRKFDVRSVWATAEREGVSMVTMVGDAYAGPLIAELRAHPYGLSALQAIGTGGAATNPKYKRALMECLPHVTIIEGYGSSETGNMAFGHSRGGVASEAFEMRSGGAIASADRTRFLRPGEREIGWAARMGRIPLGYFNDAEATQRTFPEIEGRRVVIPGDRATIEADGSIRLLGRDSLVVNTGGEKVFVEEVEEVLRAHPDVADALVVGRSSERWGQEVVGLVATHPGVSADEHDLYACCISRLAHFKAPKALIFVKQIERLGNGKPNYRWAKQLAEQQLSAKELG
ncbi:Long-chain-fatty-acid--CoA ligase FadD19 [Mycobacterium basiliense]|uniref:Long-chain-fatty-acid--CoA ligase FadD19 n=1 Tax=Mycobacterium basiliense TaxID=2094119 RepID=A0A3S4BK08_9MYCO|nr:acyl-CoA synthetase [Mycobacterium basiliense]VDM89908.1 Long-chain-fatty-acid--CoA ligase FadD19 [Mycobacterium basiliense]